jgi:hypothetical protein
VAPAEGSLDALQLALEEESREACEGTSKIGTSKGKIARLTSLVDVLAGGKELKSASLLRGPRRHLPDSFADLSM